MLCTQCSTNVANISLMGGSIVKYVENAISSLNLKAEVQNICDIVRIAMICFLT